jgi:4-amino-4-deoxy-L-arabinose transferase-like glycosyltransferase
VLLVASLFRLPFLDRSPSSISDDELMYVVDAKAIWNTGRNMTNAWSPFGFVRNTVEFPHTELPHLIIAPIIGLAPFSLAWAHFPYAISNILLVLALYFFSKKLFSNNTAFIVGLVAAINPWNIFFGRTSFDATLAIAFFMTGMCLVAYVKGKNVLFLIIPFLLAFGTYIGTRTNFILFVGFCCYFGWRFVNKNKFGKYYLAVFLVCTSVCVYYFAIFNTLSVSHRMNELFTPSSEVVTNMVNNERRQAIQTPLTNFFANKPVVFLRLCIDKYLQFFSPTMLFTNGDYRATFSLYRHGYFYYIDILFLGLGLFYIAKRYRNIFWFLLSLILIAPIPSVASQASTGFAAIRGIILYPILTIFIGAGIANIIEWAKKRKIYKQVVIILLLMYVMLVANFINIYVFQYPIYSAESYSFSSRILSKYLVYGNNEGKNIVVYTTSPKERFIYYLFFSGLYKNNIAKEIQQKFTNKQYFLNSIRFENCLIDIKPNINTSYVIESGGCDKMKILLSQLRKTIPILADGGSVYSIVGDTVCASFALPRYPNDIKFSDLSVEKLDKERFCTKFITEVK